MIKWPDSGFKTIEDLKIFIEKNPEWKKLLLKHSKSLAKPTKRGPDKYFNLNWLDVAFNRWMTIKNHNLIFDSVLDIGTGFGYFSITGKYIFGIKEVEATDVPNSLYDEVTEIFGIIKHKLFIKKFQELENLNKKYDLITSHRIVFDSWNGRWEKKEWLFFLKDIYKKFLNKDGNIVLSFNKRESLNISISLGANILNKKDRMVVFSWENLKNLYG